MKKSKRQRWLTEYERQLVELFPSLRGKVDWDTALYLFFEDNTVSEAISKVSDRYAKALSND